MAIPKPQLSRVLALGAVLAVAVGPATEAAPLDRGVAAETRAFVPGEAIVRFEPGTGPAERSEVRQAAGVELDRGLELAQAQVVTLGGSVEDAVRRLERQPAVAYAQPNYRYRSLAVATPNDTFFGDLWGLQDAVPPNPGVDALEAWEHTRGAGQVIAVVDTGVALDHPDLQGNLWSGPGGIRGHDFVDGDNDPDDYDFHGTHVAGTAAASAGNGLGVAGVAPSAQIMAVRVLDGDGSGSTSDIANGIVFAAQNGADVINLSLGGPANVDDPLMSNAVTVADGLDAVVVAAAGNDAGDNDASPTTPCTLPQANLICVAAVTPSGALASFSNFGATTVDVGAPGTAILSARNDYASVFAEGFDAGIAGWTTAGLNGGTPWSSVAGPNSDGTPAATDSSGGSYANSATPLAPAEARLVKATGLDLSAERGCRMNFDVRHDLEEDFDFLEAGAVTAAGLVSFDGRYLTGSTGGSFLAEEVSISDLGGEDDVTPWFALLSDESVVDDGAYVDDLDVRCRDDTYVDAKTAAGSYVTFNGTSMATPHVAGVAALIGAVAPGLTDAQVVQAIQSGGSPLASLAGKTVSGRTADADGAVAAALGLPDPTPSGSAPPLSPGGPASPTPLPGPIPPAVPAPRSAPLPLPASSLSLVAAKATVRVSRRGVFRYEFRATPSVAGRVAFRTRRKVTVARRAHLSLGSRAFAAPATGRVLLKVKLSRRQLRLLRRNGRFLLNVTADARGVAGESLRSSRRLTLKPPRR
jgi:subtilisin family serine protease